MSAPSSRVVHVDIHGQQYALRSDLDPAYVSRLAIYIDDKMRLASHDIASVDALRIAVIAALNITDELFRARADGDGLESHILRRTADIERLLDAVLANASPLAIAANS